MFGEGSSKERMGIVVRSFGFKHGLPLDSDLVLDVRFCRIRFMWRSCAI